MKISFIKYKEEMNFKIPKAFGINVEEINKPEEIDEKIEKLKKEHFKTIIISNELASFSEKITNEYKNDEKINIIIMPTKKQNLN